jgi:hypothetical protein
MARVVTKEVIELAIVFAAARWNEIGTSRHFAVAQQFGRFRSEADIEPLPEPDF